MSKNLDFDRKLDGALNEISERHIEEAAKAVRLEHNGFRIFRNIVISAGAVAVAAAVFGVIITNMPEKRRGVDLVESSRPVDPAALLEALPARASETEKTRDEEPASDTALPDEPNPLLSDWAYDSSSFDSYTVPSNVPEELSAIDPVELTDEYIQSGYIQTLPYLLYAAENGFLVFTDGADGVYSAIVKDNSRLLSEVWQINTRFNYTETLSAVESLLPFASRDITYGAGAAESDSGAVPLVFALSDDRELLCWKYDDNFESPTNGKFVLMSREETDHAYATIFSNLRGALPGSSDPKNAEKAKVGKSDYSITFDESRKITSIRIRRTKDGITEVVVPLVDEEKFKSMIDVSDWALPLDKEYTPDTDVYRRVKYLTVPAPDMSAVYAAGDGEIVYYDYAGLSGKGVTLVLKLDSGEYVMYTHLHSFKLDDDSIGTAYPERALVVGDRVSKGQIIARVGSTGAVPGTVLGVRAFTADEYEYKSEQYKRAKEESEKNAVVWTDEMNLAANFISDCYFDRVYIHNDKARPFSDYIDNEYLCEYAERAIEFEYDQMGEGPYTRMVSFGTPTDNVVGDTHYISITMTVDYFVDVGIGYIGTAENSFEYDCVVAIRDCKVVDFSIGNMGGGNIAWIYGMRLNPDAFDMSLNPNPWEDEEKAKAVLDYYYNNAVPINIIEYTDWNELTGEEIWALLADYSGVDVGSGLYIMTYHGKGFNISLRVTGIPDSSVYSVELVHPTGSTLELRKEQHSAKEINRYITTPFYDPLTVKDRSELLQ